MRACESLLSDSNDKKSTRVFPPCISKNNYFLYIAIFSIISSEMEQYTTQYEIERNSPIYNHKK